MNLLVNAVHLKARYAFGFTLIELVITLVIIGVLSALGAGLFASPSAYSSVSARDQLVSSALLAQKMALANTCKTIVLVVEESEDEWRFVVRKEDRENCGKSEKAFRALVLLKGTAPASTWMVLHSTMASASLRSRRVVI